MITTIAPDRYRRAERINTLKIGGCYVAESDLTDTSLDAAYRVAEGVQRAILRMNQLGNSRHHAYDFNHHMALAEVHKAEMARIARIRALHDKLIRTTRLAVHFERRNRNLPRQLENARKHYEAETNTVYSQI